MSLVSVESSIKTESSRNSKLATDLDNFRNRYSDVDPINGIQVTFPAFDILTFEKNLFIMLNNSERIKFKNRWYMRPDYTSFDMYGTVIYWNLIMYINNIYTIEEFVDFETILVPPYSTVFKLFNDRQIDKKILPLQETVRENQFVNQFYKKYQLDKLEMERIAAQEELTTDKNKDAFGIYNTEKLETITLSATDISNKYIDLIREPSNISSISLSLNNLSVNQRYNYDYVLKYDGNNSLRRISWKLSDIVASSGNDISYSQMSTMLRVGTIMKIKYGLSLNYRLSDGTPNI